MKNSTFRFIVDLIAYCVFLALISTGLLLFFTFPPGSRGGHGLTLWSWDRHDIGDLHFYLAMVFVAVILLHVVLQWSWIVTMFQRCVSRGAGVALSAIALLTLGAIILPFAAPVERSTSASERHGDDAVIEYEAGTNLRGSMTLGEIEAASGIPLDAILRELGIDDDPNELRVIQAGSYLRDRNMSMNRLRDAVSRIQTNAN